MASPAEAGASEGRGARGAGCVLHPQSARQGPQPGAQGQGLVGRPGVDSEHSTFLAAEGPGLNSCLSILQKPPALHLRALQRVGVDSSRCWRGAGGRCRVTARPCPCFRPPRPGWVPVPTLGMTLGSSLRAAPGTQGCALSKQLPACLITRSPFGSPVGAQKILRPQPYLPGSQAGEETPRKEL